MDQFTGPPRVRTAGKPRRRSWPTHDGALTATFEFGFMRADTHMRINKGVFVIVLFVTFLDDSGRSNYFNREFFYAG